jgi:hypothetical protein
MKWKTTLLLFGLIGISAALGVRAADYAAEPPFAVGVTIHRRPRIRLEGVSFSRPIGEGVVTIRARRAEPGHRRVGHLALGPSTHLVLEDAEVEYRGPSAREWTARGRRANLTVRGVEITDGAVLVPARGRGRRCETIVVDLADGRISVE